MNCQYCGKEFSKGYNLRRHENDYCPSREDVDTDSDDEMPIRKKSRHVESDEEMSSSSGEDENSENSETNDESDGEDEIDPWVSLIDDAKLLVQPAYDELVQAFIADGHEESEAKEKANEEILPALQKELADVYQDKILWIKALKKDPVHRKIMETKDAFVSEDSFDPGEALSAAVDKRKFLFRRVLEERQHFADSDNDSD